MNPADYLPPPAAASPVPRTDDHDSGWVTMSRTRYPHSGRWVLTQKRDGSTRTVLEGRT